MASSVEEILEGANIFDVFKPDAAKERQREEDADDARFWRSFLYFFELVVPTNALEDPPSSGETVTMLFPLVMNPQVYSVSEPFSVAVTPTVNGGVFVEENGILVRRIRIEGVTGFRPRRVPYSPWSDKIKTDDFSFRQRGKYTVEALSGQRHFQFLEDRVFRTYGELKRDPATAERTRMAFHNVKDEEHFFIIPIQFESRRTVGERFLYRYTIEFLAVDKAESKDITQSEDKSWFDKVKDAVQDVKDAVDTVVSVIQEVQEFVQELEQLVTGVIELVNKISDVINSISDFVNGVADFIAAPFRAIADVTNGIHSAIDRMADLPESFRDTVRHSFRQMEDAFDAIGMHKDLFTSSAQATFAQLNQLRTIATGTSAAALREAADNPATSLQDLARKGTAPLSGDAQRAKADRSPKARTKSFSSTTEHQVTSTDTLESLAARYLGDARDWRYIAALNDLKSPFISEFGLPGTVRVGDRILIPSRSQPPAARPSYGIFGATQTEPLEEQLLGRDLRLIQVHNQRNRYDLEVDPATGGTDFRLVKGVDNLIQAINTRILTVQGSNVLYRRLGVRRLIGTGFPVVDQDVIRLTFREAIEADPRIARVGNVVVRLTSQFDAIEVELDAQVRGFNRPVKNITTQAQAG